MASRSKFKVIGLLIFGACLFLGAAKDKGTPLHKKTFKDILNNYLFIADFSQYPETRAVSEEIFWKYPIKLSMPDLPVYLDLDNPEIELPASHGEGRELQHMNEGRRLFLLGEFKQARDIWLAGKQNYGKDYAFHRRNDYFIALAFMQLAKQSLNTGLDWNAMGVRDNLANAATFLSYAFVIKRDEPDSLFEKVSSKQLYNLAAIYYRYERYAGAYGAADSALNYLRKTGQDKYRPLLRRILVEAHIKNRSYLDAIKEIDLAIRQDIDPKLAAEFFARAADIYFDLNNYELAEDTYALSNRIYHETDALDPTQFILRGESLFWLGKFSEAQKNFSYALATAGQGNALKKLSNEMEALAYIRIADSYLALNKLQEAKLAYFNLQHEFRGTLQAKIAGVRHACLELPQYDGNNVKHARSALAALRKDQGDLPAAAIEIAWACEVASYSQRERTIDMTERVREFYNQYPNSKFLKDLIEPVREVKAEQLAVYLEKKQFYNAISFFEKTRATLFKKVPTPIEQQLFTAYLDTFQAEKAKEFWTSFLKKSLSDFDLMRLAAFEAETAPDGQKQTQSQAKLTDTLLDKKHWDLTPDEATLTYIQRILATPSAHYHASWIYQLLNGWDKKDPRITCSFDYPVMKTLLQQQATVKISKDEIIKNLGQLIAELFPKLLEAEETCAISLLELEYELLVDQPKKLAALYHERQKWGISKPLAYLYWQAAELNEKNNNHEEALDLWRILRDKAPANTPEQTFAKLRLDRTTTELEGLWQ